MAEQVNEKQTFDYQTFVRELAQQADSLVPVDVNQEDRQYVTNMVYNFCNLACEAILKEENFSLEEATIITQIIGEWTFHKSIDLIRAGIVPQFRDSVLQNIAFVVFEIAKQAISKKFTQPEVIQVVEHHVQKKYMESLDELLEKNLISQDDYDKAMGQSNIDKMAKEQEEVEQQNDLADISDSKLLKLATFAMILKEMPEDKAEKMINKFPPREAEILRNYVATDDLSSKIDPTITKKYMSELKADIPVPERISDDKLQNKLAKIVTKKNESKIDDIILNERDGIKNYILTIKDNKPSELPSRVSNIVYSYLTEKINK